MKRVLLVLLILSQVFALASLCACSGAGGKETETAETLQTASLSAFSESLTNGEETTAPARVGVSGVKFDLSELTLEVGGEQAVTARVLPENATNKGVSYTVGDGAVIAYENGVVKALAEGQTVLTAEADEDGYIARLTVRVLPATNPVSPTTDTPEPTTVTPDPTSVTPLPTTDTPDPTTDTPAPVRVTGVEVSPSALEMTVGETKTVTVRVLPDNAEDKSYTVSAGSPVVSIENGVLTALAAGSAEVVFTTADGGYRASVNVTVTEKQGEEIPNASRYDENGLPTYTPTFEDGVEYYDFNAKNTYHLFCHNLVAFDDPDDYFYSDCITVTEFRRILDQLYARDYILIDIDYMYEYSWKDGLLNARIKNSIKLPKGKKAIILSVDNVCYPRGEHGKGRCDRLQVVNGQLMTYTLMPDGTELYSTDNEVFTILDGFIKTHPDFSFSGARCVVAPSGYEGLFGWDTVPGSSNYEQSVAEAKKIVKWFNEHGFTFACHSYYHKDFKTMTLEQIANDRRHWMDECYPIVGRTHVFIYPFGSFTAKGSEQAKALNEAGYAVFCATSYYAVNWNDFPLEGNCYNERVTLASKLFVTNANNETLAKLFDVYTVYENEAHSVKLYKD